MIDSGLSDVEFIAVDTLVSSLEHSRAAERLLMGPEVTRGLGTSGDSELGRDAAAEVLDELSSLLSDADMVVLVAALGGGTGTGAAPVIARAARDLEALTIGIVTLPFGFEGRTREARARDGLAALLNDTDAVITIPGQRIIENATDRITMREVFGRADGLLGQTTRALTDLVTQHSIVCFDFGDVRTIMMNQGQALVGIGFGQGEQKAIRAARSATEFPLIDEHSLAEATSVMINITGNSDLTMFEVHEASMVIQEEVHQNANVVWTWIIDEAMVDEISVTVIATGFKEPQKDGSVSDAESPPRPTVVARRAVSSIDPDDYEIPTFFRETGSSESS